MGSLTGLVPTLDRVEQGFNIQGVLAWIGENWIVSVYCSTIYLLFIVLGRQWMSMRPAYDLRKPLILWNTGLATFSILGMIASVPNLVGNIYTKGLRYTTCNTDCISETHRYLALWGWVFVLSKVLEFGDTFFIVLRKTPLPFLHWYHHITVCVYTWYALTPHPSALSNWFSSMNYTVHALMYTYYALRASGFKLHPHFAKTVTVLQLSQMFMGIFINVLSWRMARSGVPCMFRYDLFYLAVLMYTSYAVLFCNFFYHRYINKATPSKRHRAATTMHLSNWIKSPNGILTSNMLNGMEAKNEIFVNGLRVKQL